MPPIVNKIKKPIANSIGVLYIIEPPHIVANQLNTFIPVGIAITIVADVKYALVLTSIPEVYIWCAHTINPTIPIITKAPTIDVYPNIFFCENVENT
jgi:hypothetical protein